MSFGDALEVLMNTDKAKVRRAGWNGKGMWLSLVPAEEWGLGSGQAYDFGNFNSRVHPWIGMRAADGSFFPWNPNQLDMLSRDWEVVD